MNFNESIIYIILFVLIINLFDFLKYRWQAGKIDNRVKFMWEFKNKWLVTIGLLSLVLLFVFYSCYYAYKGFSDEYTITMSLVGTVPFLIGGLVLIRKSILITLVLQKKDVGKNQKGHTPSIR